MTQTCRSEPRIGDRKIIKSIECIYIPDPWAWDVCFPCWCSVPQLLKEGYKL